MDKSEEFKYAIGQIKPQLSATLNPTFELMGLTKADVILNKTALINSVFTSHQVFILPGRGMATAFKHINKHQLSQQILQKNELSYVNTCKISSIGIFRTDLLGNCFYVNERWSELSGIRLTMALGQGWRKAIHPDDLDLIVNGIPQNVSSFSNKFRFQHANGRIIWVFSQTEVETNPYGEAIGYIGTVVDITEEQQPQQTLKESEEKFQATFEQAAVGIAYLTVDGRWLRVNQKLCEILGYSQVEILGLPFAEIIHPDRETGFNNIRQLLTGEIKTYSQQQRYIRKNNLPIWINLTISLLRPEPRQAQQRPEYFIAVVEDISEYKQAQQALQESEERFHTMVDTVPVELTRSNTILAQTTAMLQKRNQELDQFAYVASHDLKAPLRAIASLSEWLEEDLADQLPPENQHQMQLLRGRVRRMEALINGLLEYSRIGRIHTELSLVNVGELLKEVIDSLQPPPTFNIEIAPGMPTLITKRFPLQQVFANLIENAIKHHLRVDGLVKISVEDQGHYYKFAVTDDGPGIAPEYHDKIFVIFQTLAGRDRKENTGIGLAIVKKIVETEGGTITLDFIVGSGSTFSFVWPKQTHE